jgi:hypothetical protein
MISGSLDSCEVVGTYTSGGKAGRGLANIREIAVRYAAVGSSEIHADCQSLPIHDEMRYYNQLEIW